MEKILANYKALTKFLALVLGTSYEIVLHWKDYDDSYYIAAIENPSVSGRTINSPITGFALKLITDGVYKEKDFVTNYKAVDKKHNTIQGSTFFIKNHQDTLLGLLCINFSANDHIALAKNLLKLANIQEDLFRTSGLVNESVIAGEDPLNPTEEVLLSSIEETISSIIDPTILASGATLSQEMKIEICKKLQENGVFKIKGAVPAVAKFINVSEPSVYRYLAIIKKKESI